MAPPPPDPENPPAPTDSDGGKEVVLHGDLELRIVEARRLPNMDLLSEHLRRCFAPCRPLISPCTKPQRHHPHHPKIITSDPYVTVKVDGATVARTRVIRNSQDPKWDEHFRIPLAHFAPAFEFHVKDNDVFGAELIGIATIPADRVASGEPINDWFPIIGPMGSRPKPESAILVSMKYTPAEENPEYRHGIAGDPEKLGIRGTYFPVRKGGMVTLYQDAHVREGELPEIKLEKGKVFKQDWSSPS